MGLTFCLPQRPLVAPSRSSGTPRIDFFTGFWQLSKDREFQMLVLAFGIPTGWYTGWIAALDVNLSNHGIEESTASHIGAASVCGSVIVGIMFSCIADRL